MSMTESLGPKWLHEVHPDSCVSVRDLKKILGITGRAINARIKVGKFPKPDWLRGRVGYWKMSAILDYLSNSDRLIVITEDDSVISKKII